MADLGRERRCKSSFSAGRFQGRGRGLQPEARLQAMEGPEDDNLGRHRAHLSGPVHHGVQLSSTGRYLYNVILAGPY